MTNAVDEQIYSAILRVLNNENPDEAKQTECVMTELRNKEIAKKFYTADLLFDADKLARDLQPLIDDAKKSCSPFTESPIGIGLIVALALLVLGIIIFAVIFVLKKRGASQRNNHQKFEEMNLND